MSFGLAELAAAVRQFCAENMPGRTVLSVRIYTLEDQQPLQLPVPAIPTRAQQLADAFVPTPLQQEILNALEGKALRTDALANKLGVERSRLFQKPKGGIMELKKEGFVESHPRLGYFRPDAPPPELASE